jgi:hypothetical protein
MGRRATPRNPCKSRVSDGEGAIIVCIYPPDKGVDTHDAGLGGQQDALNRLENDVDAWVATADAGEVAGFRAKLRV